MPKNLNLALSALALAATLSGEASAFDEQPYAQMGRWSVVAVSDGGQFGFCAADTDNGQVQLRIGTNGRQWQVGVPYYDEGAVSGQFGFGNLDNQGMFGNDGDGWASMAMSRKMVQAFRTQKSFSIEIDRGPQTFKLKGASAALDKALECARNEGEASMADNGQYEEQDPAPTRRQGQGRRYRQGQVIAPVEGTSCPMKGVILSNQFNNKPSVVTYVNQTSAPVDLFWIAYDSNWVYYATVNPGESMRQQTYTNHAWVGVQNGDCVTQPDWYVYKSRETVVWN